MKKRYPTLVMNSIHLHPGKLVLIFGLLFWFIPVLMAQEVSFDPEPFNGSVCEDLRYDNIVTDENPNAPLVDYYDGRKTAYITTGGSGGSENNLVDWSSANWIRCFFQGGHIGNPTPLPVAKYNGLYLQISAGDFVTVNTLSYHNNVTIVVCGYLEIGEFAVEIPIEFTDFNLYLGSTNFSIDPSAKYNSDFSLNQEDAFTYGFSIVPKDGTNDIFDPAHRIYPLDSDWNEAYDETLQKWVGDFGFTNLTHWKNINGEMETFVAGVDYEIVAFVVDNESGAVLYYLEKINEFSFSSSGDEIIIISDGSEQDSSSDGSDGDDGAFLNNVNIVICEGGFLKATTLDLKNTVNIYNYGTLQVGKIIGQGSASKQCIQGTGDFQDLYGNTIIEHDNSDDNDVWYVNDDYVSDVDPDGNLGWTFGDDCGSPFIVAPLPVELLSFNSKAEPENIEFNWVTATEINNEFFTLERSSDLYAWEIVGHVQGAGTTSEIQQYSFRDHSPREGISYYRLKQTDFDGQFEYFDPLSVSYMPGADGLDFRVARHPDQWTIFVPGEGAYHIEMYDLTGRKIYSDMVVNNITIPAPGQTVVVRVFNDRNHSASRVVM